VEAALPLVAAQGAALDADRFSMLSVRMDSMRRHAGRIVAVAGVLGVLLACGLVAASGAAGAPSVVGRSPAMGHGVLRFPQAIAFSAGGRAVFVADQYGSVVQRFDRQGAWEMDIGWRADNREYGRIGTIGGLATDRLGHLYVLDSENDRVQVFRMEDGAWLGAWGSRGEAPGAFRLGANTGAGGIAIFHPEGATAPIAYIADQYNHRIQRFVLDADGLPPGLRSGDGSVVPAPTADRVWGRFGDCSSLGGCTDPAYDDWLQYPQGIAVQPVADAPEGHVVFVPDDRNHRVLRYATDGRVLGQVGSYGSGPGQFAYPYDVGVDGQAAPALYVSDNMNHRIQRFDAATLAFQSTWSSFGSHPGGLEYPRALAALADDPLGGVYVADTANNRVQGFDAQGNVTASWGIAGRGPGYVTRPGGVAVADDGRVLIADTFDHRVQVLDRDGGYLGQWGYISANSGFAAPASGNGQFSRPQGIAHDPRTGRAWVADTVNNRLQEFGADGRWIATHDGFLRPRAVAVAPDGAVYVADTGNRRVQRRDPGGGTWSTVELGSAAPNAPVAVAAGTDSLYVAGTGYVVRIVDGVASAVAAPPTGFALPTGLAVDAGLLYVSDSGTDRVWRHHLGTGAWTSLAGEGPDLGQVLDPAGLAVTADGASVLVADTGNNRVQALDGVAHAPATVSLSVRLAGDGTGHVAADGAAIDCGALCDTRVAPGRRVRLTARPATGSSFAGWDGACTGTGDCVLDVREATRVTAIFVLLPPPPPPAPTPSPGAIPPPPPPATSHTKPPVTEAARDTKSPRLRRAALTRGRAVRFWISETATVRMIVWRPTQRSGRGCGRNAGRTTRCRRLVALVRPRLFRAGRGTNRRALPAAARRGRLVISLRATDAAGNRSPAVRLHVR